ncbi:unnamed protein product [Diamesa hyperborea]
MDLLKTVLKKTTNTLEDRLNYSNTSEMSCCGYESALDQSNSLYFSMSENDGDKTTTFDESSVSERTLKCSDNSIATPTDSPSITFISSTPMKIINLTFETVLEDENILEDSPSLDVPVIHIDTSESDNNLAVNPFTCGGSQKKEDVAEVSPQLEIPAILCTDIDNDNKIAVDPITCEEPQEKENVARVSSSRLKVPAVLYKTSDNDNKIVVNPFTRGSLKKKEVAEVSSQLKVPDILCNAINNDNNIAVNPITRKESQKLVTNIKKPTTAISKIATRSHLYNPIIRKSLDKLSPMYTTRRSVAITKPIQKVPILPKAKVTFPCEWCKKSFDINKALTNHLIEYCQKIPCNERKKLTNPVESNTDQKRKSVFVMPTARTTTATSNKRPRMNFNITGIIKTPTKTLMCTLCALKFQDVSSYAKHIITHKKS